MKLGVMGAGLGGMEWEKALDYCQQVGLEAIELPVGAYPGKPFFKPEEVLESPNAQQKIKDDCAKRNLEIRGLAIHGNPVSPNPEMRAEHEEQSGLAGREARRGARHVAPHPGVEGPPHRVDHVRGEGMGVDEETRQDLDEIAPAALSVEEALQRLERSRHAFVQIERSLV